MAFLGKALPFVSPIAALLGVGKKTAPTPQMATPVVTRDAAAEAARRDDELRRRRGAGANVAAGTGGSEARSAGGKVLLGQ